MNENQLTPSEIDAINVCISMIQNGSSIDDCLAIYPNIKNKIRPVLTTAFNLQESNKSVMPRDELKQSLLKLLTNEFSINSSKVRSFFKFSWVFQRGFAALLIAFISITSSGWLVSTASAASIPGETLYPVKTFKEEIRFQIINSDAEKVKFRTELIQERVKEIELIIARKQSAETIQKATLNINSHLEKTLVILLDKKVRAGLITENKAKNFYNIYGSRAIRSQCLMHLAESNNPTIRFVNARNVSMENSHVYLRNILLSEIERQKNMPEKFNSYLSKDDQIHINEAFHCSQLKLSIAISLLDELAK